MAVEETSRIEHIEPNLIGNHSVDLTVIHEAARCIGSEGSSQEAVNKILRLMSEMVGLNRGRVLLPDEATGGLRIRYSYGLTQDQVDKGLYSPGEGITGKVMQSKQVAVIQNVDDEQNFLFRAVDREVLPEGVVSYLRGTDIKGPRLLRCPRSASIEDPTQIDSIGSLTTPRDSDYGRSNSNHRRSRIRKNR